MQNPSFMLHSRFIVLLKTETTVPSDLLFSQAEVGLTLKNYKVEGK